MRQLSEFATTVYRAFEDHVRESRLALPYATQRLLRAQVLLSKFGTQEAARQLAVLDPEEAARRATPDFAQLAGSTRSSYIAHTKALQEFLRDRGAQLAGQHRAPDLGAAPAPPQRGPVEVMLPGRGQLVAIRGLPSDLTLKEVARIQRVLEGLAMDFEP